MKSSRSLFMMLFVALLMVCFMSLPVLSGNGDEDPWGADDPNDGTTGGSSDTLIYLGSANSLYTNIGTDLGAGTFESLFFSVSFEIVYYFFGSSYGSDSEVAVSSTQVTTVGNTGFSGLANYSSMK